MQQLAFWRDISLVILGLECLVVLVLLVVINYVLVRLTGNLHIFARTYARKTQAVTDMVATRTEQIAAKAREPVIAANASETYVRESARAFFRNAPHPPDEPTEQSSKE